MAITYYAKCEPTIDAFKFLVSIVIAADESFVNSQPGYWVLTDYNCYGNVHYEPSPPAEPHTPDGLPAIRANFASIGYTYDKANDVFYAPQPYPSWVLNTTTWLWEAPVAYPIDGKGYIWNESAQSWVLAPGQ
jgi:hypothetical protein